MINPHLILPRYVSQSLEQMEYPLRLSNSHLLSKQLQMSQRVNQNHNLISTQALKESVRMNTDSEANHIKYSELVGQNLQLTQKNEELVLANQVWQDNYEHLLLKATTVSKAFDDETLALHLKYNQEKTQINEQNQNLLHNQVLMYAENERLNLVIEDLQQQIAQLTIGLPSDKLKRVLKESQVRENHLFQELQQNRELVERLQITLEQQNNQIENNTQVQILSQQVQDLIEQNQELSQIIIQRCKDQY